MDKGGLEFFCWTYPSLFPSRLHRSGIYGLIRPVGIDDGMNLKNQLILSGKLKSSGAFVLVHPLKKLES